MDKVSTTPIAYTSSSSSKIMYLAPNPIELSHSSDDYSTSYQPPHHCVNQSLAVIFHIVIEAEL
jgi:hypothetical protein